jgi:hypothetical protein
VCFRVIYCWSHCVFSHHPSFFLVFLLRLHQTLARRNHLPCFSPSVTSNPSAPQPSSLFLSFGYIKPSQRHKPSQRRFLIFLLRLRKKTEKKQTESTPLPCFSPSVTSKKTETKKRKRRRKDTKRLSHLGRFKHTFLKPGITFRSVVQKIWNFYRSLLTPFWGRHVFGLQQNCQKIRKIKKKIRQSSRTLFRELPDFL